MGVVNGPAPDVEPAGLPDLPGCGRRATTRFELYANASYSSLDGSVDLCDEHADAYVLREATGLMPYRVTMTAPRRCGDGFDFTAMCRVAAPANGWPPPGDDAAARCAESLRRAATVMGVLCADLTHAARNGNRFVLRGLLSAVPAEARVPWVQTLAELGPGADPVVLAGMVRDAAHRQVSALRFHLRVAREGVTAQ